MDEDFEEWKKRNSPFQEVKNHSHSEGNNFWQLNTMRLEKEMNYYRKQFNDARKSLVTNRVAVDELAKVREREKTEMELRHEVEINGIRKDTIEKIERYQQRHLLNDEEKYQLRAELDFLRLQRQNEEAASTSEPQRAIYDHELRELLLNSGFLKTEKDARENQELQNQLRSELKSLADRIRDIENEEEPQGQKWKKEKETYDRLQESITNRTREMQSDFDSRLQELQNDWAHSKQEALHLRHKLEEEKAKREALKNQLLQLNHAVNDTRIKNERKLSNNEVNMKLQKLNQEKADLERKLDRCEMNNENSQQKLYQEKKGFVDKLQAVEKEKIILEKKLLNFEVDENKMKKLKADLNSKEEEIEKIRGQLEQAENAQKRSRDSEESLYLENEQLRNNLIALTLELSKQRSQQNREEATIFRQLAGEENAKNAEIMKLRQQLAVHEQKVKQSSSNIGNYKAEIPNKAPVYLSTTQVPKPASLLSTYGISISTEINNDVRSEPSQYKKVPFQQHESEPAHSIDHKISMISNPYNKNTNKQGDIRKSNYGAVFTTKNKDLGGSGKLESKRDVSANRNEKRVTFAQKPKDECQSYDFELQKIFSSAEQRKIKKFKEAHSSIRRSSTSKWKPPQIIASRPTPGPTSKFESEDIINAIHQKTVNRADKILDKITAYQKQDL